MSRAAPALLIASAVLLIAGFVLHPMEYRDAQKTVDAVGDQADAWALAHWLLAAGGALLAAAAFMVRGQGSLTGTKGGRTVWLILGLCAVLAIEVFVVEATLSAQALRDGDAKAFEQSTLYSIPGLVGLVGLSVTGVFLWVGQARAAQPMVPKWLSWVYVVAAALGIVGFFAFGFGNEMLANLQYATGLYILGFLVLGIQMLRKGASAPMKP